MPAKPNPPFATGALSIPRTLNRWLDKNYLRGHLERISTYITLPAFSVNYIWNGYSEIVASFNFEGPNNFSLTGVLSGTPAQQAQVLTQANQTNAQDVFNLGVTFNTPYVPVLPIGQILTQVQSPNYLLCISWRTVSGLVYRYALWQNVGETLYFPIPLYTGQPIMKNFRLEVWSTSQGTTASSVNPVYLYTSVKGQIDYRFGLDSQLVANDGLETTFGVNTSVPSTLIEAASSGTPALNGIYFVSGTYNSKNIYTMEGYTGVTVPTGGTPSIYWSTTQISWFISSDVGNTYYRSTPNNNVATPDLVSSWENYVIPMPDPTVTTFEDFALPLVWPVGSYSTSNPDAIVPYNLTTSGQIPVISGSGTIIIYNTSSTQIVYYVNDVLPNPNNINAPAIGTDPNGLLPTKTWNIQTQTWN